MPSGVPLNDIISGHFSVPSPGAVNDKVRAFFDQWYFGVGSPEGVVTAPAGSLYLQQNGTTVVIWQKVSGSGNTGWGAAGGVGANTVYVPASRCVLVAGAPSLVATGGWTRWLMDPAATESVGAMLGIEELSGWLTYKVEAIWAKEVVAGGNVRAQYEEEQKAIGSAPVGLSVVTTTTFTAGANIAFNKTSLIASRAHTADTLTAAVFTRLGADGADTYASDIGFYGFLLTRLT